MKFALVFFAMCSQHCVPASYPSEDKVYSSFHACFVDGFDRVPRIYKDTGLHWKFRCDQRPESAGQTPTSPDIARAQNGIGIQPLVQMESGGNAHLVNRFGYAGLFQFGAPLLFDLGLYIPGPTEVLSNWSKTGRAAAGKWSGTFRIPGFPTLRTLSDFLENEAAQFAAFRLHRATMETQIAKRGLSGYIGHEIAGLTITPAALEYMIHLGGVGGAERVLQTQGRVNPKDANGTSLLDYARLSRLGTSGQGQSAVEDQAAAP
jgi:hypothetical protein